MQTKSYFNPLERMEVNVLLFSCCAISEFYVKVVGGDFNLMLRYFKLSYNLYHKHFIHS